MSKTQPPKPLAKKLYTHNHMFQKKHPWNNMYAHMKTQTPSSHAQIKHAQNMATQTHNR